MAYTTARLGLEARIMVDGLDEQACVLAARSGDRRAFEALIARYERPVYNLALRMLGRAEDAEDAGQEVFLKAYRALSAYDTGRPFSTWLLSIAAHHCIDRIRRRRMQEVSLDALPPWRQVAAQTPDPEDAAVSEDHSSRVRQYLQLLPEDYRVVVVLRYWHDFGYAEIAALTGESESAIKSRLHRARRQLAEHMTNQEPGALSGVDVPVGVVGQAARAPEAVAPAGAAMVGP